MTGLKFSNQGGFPLIEAVSVVENGTTTTINFNNHPYRQSNRFYGGFFIKIAQDTTTLTQTNNVEFATVGIGGSNLPLYSVTGTQVQISELASTGPAIFLIFYDKDSNRIQLIN